MSYSMYLERDPFVDSLHVIKGDRRVRVDGVAGYEGRGYRSDDPLHRFLDSLDPPSVSVLMSGVRYDLNAKNPRTQVAIAAADKLFAEQP